jgi:hypothetical protein
VALLFVAFSLYSIRFEDNEQRRKKIEKERHNSKQWEKFPISDPYKHRSKSVASDFHILCLCLTSLENFKIVLRIKQKRKKKKRDRDREKREERREEKKEEKARDIVRQ